VREVAAWLGFVLGLCVLAVTWSSVVKTLLVPRNMPSLINANTARAVLVGFRVVAARVADAERREALLATGPPVFLVTLLAAWIASLFLGYALVLLPFTGSSPVAALRLSGSSLFTLGFATPGGPVPYAIVFLAAISGIGVIALMIGYSAMRTIAVTLRVPVNDDPHPSDPLLLTRADFDDAVRRLVEAGWTFERTPEAAWPHFRGWRVNYETAAHNIAAHLDLPAAPWSGSRSYLGAATAMPVRPVNREPALWDGHVVPGGSGVHGTHQLVVADRLR
jgi:hypothetical protein